MSKRQTYILTQTANALIEALGMFSENIERNNNGYALAYDESAFDSLVDKYGISHNQVLKYLEDEE